MPKLNLIDPLTKPFSKKLVEEILRGMGHILDTRFKEDGKW